MSLEQPSDTTTNDGVQPTTETAQSENAVWKSGPLTGLCFTVLGGLLVWVVLQSFHPVFTNEAAQDAFGELPPAVQRQLQRDNSIFVIALLGGLTAAGLAVSECLSQRSTKAALGAVAAFVSAAALGGLAGYLGFALFKSLEPRHDLTDLAKTIRVQGMMFTAMGGAIGLSVGVFLGRRLPTAIQGTIAGALAGAMAGITYPIIVALLIPAAVTKVVIPLQGGERLLWLGLATALLGVTIPAIARKKPAKKTKNGSGG